MRDIGSSALKLLHASSALLLSLSSLALHAELFTDVAPARGLNHTEGTYGASWSKDANGDGFPDLWLGNHSHGTAPIYYESDGLNGFNDATPLLNGLFSADFHGASWGDFNRDGLSDLLVITGAAGGDGSVSSQLFINDGTQYSESAESLGIDYAFGRGRHITWFDWNSDGFLDAIVINRNNRSTPPDAFSAIFTFDPQIGAFSIEPEVIHDNDNQSFATLLLNNVATADNLPTFLTIAREASATVDTAFSFSGAGFTDVSAGFAAPIIDRANDAVPADMNNDGQTDLIVASGAGLHLWLQTPAGFVDATVGSGLDTSAAAYVVAADFNNDMHNDIYVARSSLGAETNLQNELYLNNGNGTFTKASNASGAAGTLTGLVSGLTAVDYNNDGHMDLFVTNTDNWWADFGVTDGAPAQLFENNASHGNNWLKLNLTGTLSNRDAIGATVVVSAGGVVQTRELNGGVHHRSQDDPRLHFGLGTELQATSVTIHWPSGSVQQLQNVAANQIMDVTEQASGGNLSPVAVVSHSAGSTPLERVFDAESSYDPDGSIESWLWNFGDGNTSTDESVTHEYAQAGIYAVALAVTDNNAATTTATVNLSVPDTNNSPTRNEFDIHAVGANQSTSSRLHDTLSNGEQDLGTFWRNNKLAATAWATLDLGDLGAAQHIHEIRIAPRAKIYHQLRFEISNEVESGRAINPSTFDCEKPAIGNSASPSQLHTCAIPATAGRYLTISSLNRMQFRIYGLEIWTASTGDPDPSGNAPPTAAFNETADLLDYDFDGSPSTDNDGMVVDWSWNFGDGSSGSGEFVSHAFNNPGTYNVALTVTDDEGAVDSTSSPLTVTGGAGLEKLAATVKTTGARKTYRQRIVDELSGDAQNLTTFWRTGTKPGTNWFTIDLTSDETVVELRLAPTANSAHELSIAVGNELESGQVTTPPAASCNIPSQGSEQVPTALFTCPIGGLTGRYLTIQGDQLPLFFYGFEAYRSIPSN